MGPSIEEQRARIRAARPAPPKPPRRKSKEEKEAKKAAIKAKNERRLKERVKVKSVFTSGVYLLYKGDEVVYVGKSDVNVMARLCKHFEDPDKDFDSYRVNHKGALAKKLASIEMSLIKRYQPRYNIVHTDRNRNKTVYKKNAK